ncbi:MAG: RecQ family ATP-dependent DNA helicase [bacterium]
MVEDFEKDFLYELARLKTGLGGERLREAVQSFLSENSSAGPAELAGNFNEWLGEFMREKAARETEERVASSGMVYDETKLRDILQKKFLINSFRPGQLTAIKNIMTSHHTLLVMPTGSGKSLCYQLPALAGGGLSLVISPLISLMKDQVDKLKTIGVSAAAINSSFSAKEQMKTIAAMQEGDYNLVYIAPERLESRLFQQSLEGIKVDLLAIDEAHCISKWGYDFRPSFRRIPEAWQKVGRPVVLATTATATPRVQKDIRKQLSLPDMEIKVHGFDRPNLYFEVARFTDEKQKEDELLEALANLKEGSAIVYVGTRNTAEIICRMIEETSELSVRYYHAGIDREERKTIQKDFLNDRVRVMVATNAFGMGIDKPDIRLVVHYNIPGTVESYYQEAGRAGRDGKLARCLLFFCETDLQLQRYFINNDSPDSDRLYKLYDLIRQSPPGNEENPLPVGRSAHCDPAQLRLACGLNEAKLRTGIRLLEEAGWIENLGRKKGKQYLKICAENYLEFDKQISRQQKRRREKFNRLYKMVDYSADSVKCRRRYILNYFGEEYDSKTSPCCDCCEGLTAENPAKLTKTEKIIIAAVKKLGKKMKEQRLAMILSGSPGSDIQNKYGETELYGKLSAVEATQIRDCIDRMLDDGLLRRTRRGRLAIKKETQIYRPAEPDYDYPLF